MKKCRDIRNSQTFLQLHLERIRVALFEVVVVAKVVLQGKTHVFENTGRALEPIETANLADLAVHIKQNLLDQVTDAKTIKITNQI